MAPAPPRRPRRPVQVTKRPRTSAVQAPRRGRAIRRRRQAYGAPQPGPWGAPAPSRGGGFLQNAASTAAGVAGGVALGNLLGGLFGGHSGGGLFGSGFGGAGIPGGGNETVNIFEDGSGNQSGNPMDAAQFDPGVPDDAGYIDDSSFDNSSGGDGGGFDDV